MIYIIIISIITIAAFRSNYRPQFWIGLLDFQQLANDITFIKYTTSHLSNIQLHIYQIYNFTSNKYTTSHP